MERLQHYVTLRMLFFPVLVLTVTFISAVLEAIRDRKLNAEARAALFGLPLAAVIFAAWIYAGKPFDGEDRIIAEACRTYGTMNGVFTYMTSYSEMMAMMVFPSIYSPLVIKILLLGLAGGYCVSRLCGAFYSYVPVILYAAFLVPPSLRLSYTVHRLPMYGALYLVFAAKLLCDRIEHRTLDRRTIITLAVVVSMLTWWRSEGIYMLVLGPASVILAYRPLPGKKTAAVTAAAILLAQAVAYVPKTYEAPLTIDNYGKHQITPFYNYAITGMLCNGLDRDKYSEELETVEEYLHIDFIDILNAIYGEHIYDEGYATYHPDYKAANPDATEETLSAYESAVRSLIIKNPGLFIKSQIRAFGHISSHYDGLCASAVFGNLWVVLGVIAAFLVWAIFRKQALCAVLALCPLCHGMITTILLPAAYFKYYYPEYLFAWLIAASAAAYCIGRIKNKAESTV